MKEIQYGSLRQKLGHIYCKPESEIEVNFVAVERAVGLPTPALWTWRNAKLTPGCSEGVWLGIKDSKCLLGQLAEMSTAATWTIPSIWLPSESVGCLFSL